MSSVIFINRYFYPDHSATSQILSDLAFNLAEGNYNVKIVTSRQLYQKTDQTLEPEEQINGVSVKRIWTTNFGRGRLIGRAFDYITFYVSAFFYLLRTVKRDDVVVAKTDPPLISVIAWLVTSIKSSKLINWNQDLFPEVGTELGIKLLKIIKPFLLFCRNKALTAAYMNIAIGETMRDKLISQGVDSDKIRVIHNWSDSSEVYSVPRNENKFVREWGLVDNFIVAYSGNMGRAHEFETILDIANKLSDDKQIKFLFIGGGAKKDWIREEASNRGLQNIVFKPYQARKDIAHSLSVADVHFISLLPCLEGLIVPSKYYGVAAVGKPCLFIGDTNGEIARIVHKYDCGISVEIGDIDSAVEYIRELKSNNSMKNEQCENARQAFLNNFESNIAYKSWREILDHALTGH